MLMFLHGRTASNFLLSSFSWLVISKFTTVDMHCQYNKQNPSKFCSGELITCSLEQEFITSEESCMDFERDVQKTP